MSEAPLGSFLSGGIDSIAIVALRTKVCPGNVKTFTVEFGDGQPGADERPYARTIAQMFKTDHSECVYDVTSLPQWEFGGLWIDRLRRFVDGTALPLPERYQQYLSTLTEPDKSELFSQDFLNQL